MQIISTTSPHLVRKVLFILFSILSSASHAAETEFTLDPVLVKANSSFDSLNDETYLPQKKIKFESARGDSLNAIEKSEPFPIVNYGYPSGMIGSALGGRSIDDTQVSTLGVPLGLPQGGGPDLSFFPSFLWSGVTVSNLPSAAGFSPQGVSGSMQFDLWTRTQVRELKFSSSVSRITANVDRNLQNYSAAVKKENAAIMGGMNFGRQTGPAGSLSYYFIRKPKSHFLLHFLGTDQDGESPGDKLFPTPKARKKSWRLIPVLESHQEFGEDETPFVWESTYYADLHEMRFEDPTAFSSFTRTQQYGMENALHWNDTTLALTARFVNFQSDTFGKREEWPFLAQLSHEFKLSDTSRMRLGGGGNSVSGVGFAPSLNASFNHETAPQRRWFLELSSMPKMPTLASRYYVLGTYRGNPGLKPEKVHAVVGGYDSDGTVIRSVTTLKGEYRNQIQINRNNTTENGGNASLFSLKEDLTWNISPSYENTFGLLFTYSKLADSQLPYPDLPYFSFVWSSGLTFFKHLKIQRTFRYMGTSTQSGGGIHDDYLLIDMSASYTGLKEATFTLGVDNLQDRRAEVVTNYPLPGRILYFNMIAHL